jgi:hypothetical protein
MSRKKRQPQDNDRLIDELVQAVNGTDVPKHRQCPICFPNLGGVGNAYSSKGPRTFYKCQACGHTWTCKVTHEQVVVEHRTVEIQTRGPQW